MALLKLVTMQISMVIIALVMMLSLVLELQQ